VLRSGRVFQPGGLLGRGWRGVTLGMAPLILQLHLYSALHPWDMFGCGVGGSSVGLAVVWGCGGDPPPSPGRICASTAGLQMGQGSAVSPGTASLLGTPLVPGSPKVQLVMHSRGQRRHQGPEGGWEGGQGDAGGTPSSSPARCRGELDCGPSFPWHSSHLRYPPFSSHAISSLASFAAFCPTQSRFQREDGAVGAGSRWLFLPWLLQPGLQAPSWDTLQVMQGLGAGRDPPGMDMGQGRGHAAGLPAAVGLAMGIDAPGTYRCPP